MSSGLWWKLQGVFCVYKPNNVGLNYMRKVIIGNLVNDLNEKRKIVKENYISIDGKLSLQTPELEVNVKEKLAIHPLAIGPAYRQEDLNVLLANTLCYYTSGVCVGGINQGTKFIRKLTNSNLIKTYQVSGILGKATDSLHFTGKVVEKSTFNHVQIGSINKVLMIIQASHQRKAMEFLGPDIQSQEAYEILSKEGLVRPGESNIPIVYSLNCVDFKLPHFTIELNCINEDENYLLNIVHNIGLMLKTNATTSKIRCIRYGPYNVDHALLHKHWRLPHIMQNIEILKTINDSVNIDTPNLKQLQEPELSI